jgi:formamidopyrimidine-DNA glycosylase
VPELPEVEVASRQLRAWAQGRLIERALATKSRVIRGQAPRRFAGLVGHRLEEIERYGKWMLLRFDGGEGLVSHLGMTGKWIRRRLGEAAPSHVRATLELDDGHAIDYRDPRLFGRLVRGPVDRLRKLPSLTALGPDPLGGIDVARLHRVLCATRRSLKEALMDQRTLAGLGNIHVAESLYRAGLHPERAASTLSAAEAETLAFAIGRSLREALDKEDGDTPITYVEEGGENIFLVYDRAGEPCATCGTEIERIVQGGRSTFFCPVCQPRAARPSKRRDPGVRAPARKPAAHRRAR